MFLTENISRIYFKALELCVYLSHIQCEMHYLLNYFKSFQKFSNPESIFTVMERK